MAIVTRTIPQGSLNIQAFVYDMLDAFQSKYIDLEEFLDDGGANNFIILVDNSWDAADDAALDALILAHNPIIPPFVEGSDLYISNTMPAPFATNSKSFQKAYGFTFNADPDWVLEMNFIYQYSIANSNQQAEIEIRFNGVPIITSRVNANRGAIEPVGGTFPLDSLTLKSNSFDVYIRKVSGNSLATLQQLLVTTEIVKVG